LINKNNIDYRKQRKLPVRLAPDRFITERYFLVPAILSRAMDVLRTDAITARTASVADLGKAP
jgi:hypothetical protein